jgi:hypothetical protein
MLAAGPDLFKRGNNLVTNRGDQTAFILSSTFLDVRPVSAVNRAAQKGVFHLDVRICNRLFIDICAAFAAETGLKSRNVEKRINAV